VLGGRYESWDDHVAVGVVVFFELCGGSSSRFAIRVERKDPPLRQRFVHLFTSCTHDHRRIDEGARRRRAIWEMSKVSLSAKKKRQGPGLESPAKIHRRNSPSFDLRHRFRDRSFGAEDHGCFKTHDYGTIPARGSQGGHRSEKGFPCCTRQGYRRHERSILSFPITLSSPTTFGRMGG